MADVGVRNYAELGWRMLFFVGASLALFLIIDRWTIWQGRSGWQSTDDAYLQADITPISAKVGGYIHSVPTDDFQHVVAGQLIAEVVDDDYRAAVAQAESGLAAARAQSEAIAAQSQLQQATIDAAAAVISSTTAALAQNSRDLSRQQRLLSSGSSTEEASERLSTTGRQLSAQLAQNRAQWGAAKKQLAVLAAQEAQTRASIAAQQAGLALAQLNLGYTRILAPQDGVLGQRQVRPGQYVAPGAQITTLTPLPKLWVIANFKETQLTHMAVGQQSEIEVDSFPGQPLKGHVVAFSPGSGSQYALLPPDNATGNFTKVVQRIAVKISLDDPGALAERLRAGMSVIAKVDSIEPARR